MLYIDGMIKFRCLCMLLAVCCVTDLCYGYCECMSTCCECLYYYMSLLIVFEECPNVLNLCIIVLLLYNCCFLVFIITKNDAHNCLC